MKIPGLKDLYKTVHCDQSGIGLVEALVAIAILGISAVSFISNLSVGSISVRTLDEAAIAQQFLTSEMETIKGVGYDVSGASYPVLTAPEGYSLTLEVDSTIYPDAGIQKITATVWRDGGRVASLENYKANR